MCYTSCIYLGIFQLFCRWGWVILRLLHSHMTPTYFAHTLRYWALYPSLCQPQGVQLLIRRICLVARQIYIQYLIDEFKILEFEKVIYNYLKTHNSKSPQNSSGSKGEADLRALLALDTSTLSVVCLSCSLSFARVSPFKFGSKVS